MRFFITLFLFSTFRLYSQDINVGLLGGMTLLNGDYPSVRLKDSFKILANPGIGAFMRFPVKNNFFIKASVYLTKFSGDDSLIPRFIGFHNPSRIKRGNTELQINAEYIPFKIPVKQSQIDFFVQSGVVLSKTNVSGSDVNDDCPIVNLGIPFGAGARYPIAPKVILFGQFEFVQGLNDCFDGFIDLAKIKDVYYSIKIGVSTLITPEVKGAGRVECPKF